VKTTSLTKSKDTVGLHEQANSENKNIIGNFFMGEGAFTSYSY